MIEQIEQVLEFSEAWFNSAVEGEPIAQDEIDLVKELNQAVRYLIGEVERLKQSNSNLLKQYHQRGKDNDKVIYDLVSVNTQLRKALEWYADEANYDDQIWFDVATDQGKRARQALKEEKK